ncbi:MAG: hypothetical protein FJ291_02420 [Planctomycetes bacterium]|nr:hypothetical protein [Planctomycetota bacterium]
MGLDVYVMPLWRFKCRDFRTPLEEAFGDAARVVTVGGVAKRPARVSKGAQARARREVEAIREAVQAANHTPIHWDDEGGVVLSEQSRGIEPLRAYAKWLGLREQLPSFGPAPEGNYYKHPAMAAKPASLSCPHLVEHSCYNGYFLPCEFERLVNVEPYKVFGRWLFHKAVGSSPRLLRELSFVQEHLKAPDGYTYESDDPLAEVKMAFLQMRKAAVLSCRHGLPIIFWA